MGLLSPVISVNISTSRMEVVRLLSAREPSAGRPARVRVQGESVNISMLLCCEETRSEKGFDVASFRVHDGTQFEVKLRLGRPCVLRWAALQLFSNDAHNL